MSAVRSAALRLEMAEGLVQAITQGGVDTSQLDEAVFQRDSIRNLLHGAVRDATGMDPITLARLLHL